MKSRRAHSFWLAMGLIVGTAVHWAGAGEKILFSTGKKDGPKNNLEIKQVRPVLQTLDFSKMGGRGSKAEELAPMTQPPEMAETEINDPKEKKQEKDWLSPTDKRNQEGNKSKFEKDQEKSKDKNRTNKDRWDGQREKDPLSLDRNEDDRFNPDQDRNTFNRLTGSGSSTNKIVFGSANRQPDQTFRPDQGAGAPVRDMGAPTGSGPSPLGEQSRTATLERLGLTPVTGGGGSSDRDNASGASGLFGLGNLQSSGYSGNGAQVSPLGQIGSMRDAGVGEMGGRDSAYKSGLLGEIGAMNLGQPGDQPRVYEAPKYERKPAVLPVPQRKFY